MSEGPRLLAALSLTAFFTTAPLVSQTPPSRDLRGGDALARAYDLILDARFNALDAELDRACGPAPQEACDVLVATALWWRIQLDPESRALDEAFSTAVDRAIAANEAWTSRTPDDPEAWFYLGGAYAARVQWRVLRNEKLAAARDGKRIKDALERAIALDPGLDDAYFGIGLYRYYADVAPTSAKILRFLLLLPGGNRHEGLGQMLRARDRGRLLQGEADYQLHVVYLWYERQTKRALELLRELQRRYPNNPLFLSQIAEIEDTYVHDIAASLDTSEHLLAQARADKVYGGGMTEVRARLGIARQLDALAETDEAIEHLERVIALKPTAPYSSLALAYLRLGEAHDRLNARADAMTAYRLAAVNAPDGDPHNIRRQSAERLRKAPNAQHAEAFRLSLEGLRQLEHEDLNGAMASLERAIAINGRDPIAHYRYGRVLEARHRTAEALTQFELTIREWRQCPPPILATAYYETGRLHERAGRRDHAIAAYASASTLVGAAEETRRLASRALTRLKRR
jgi:tetratricopeptide (TPR) repeat protein